MNKDDSDRVEDLIMLWHHWAARYRLALGAPKSSIYLREATTPDVYADDDDRQARVDTIIAEQVEACIDDLPWQWRSAVGIHAANKAARAQVFRNPRMTSEQQHAAYQQAKESLLVAFRKKGLLQTGQN